MTTTTTTNATASAKIKSAEHVQATILFGPILLGFVFGTWTYCNRNF